VNLTIVASTCGSAVSIKIKQK